MRQSHWTKFLPEAGTIKDRGEDQERIQRQIAEHKKQIRSLQQEFKKSEESLTKFCVSPDYWTEEEVETAKKRAEKEAQKLNDRT